MMFNPWSFKMTLIITNQAIGRLPQSVSSCKKLKRSKLFCTQAAGMRLPSPSGPQSCWLSVSILQSNLKNAQPLVWDRHKNCSTTNHFSCKAYSFVNNLRPSSLTLSYWQRSFYISLRDSKISPANDARKRHRLVRADRLTVSEK